MNKSSLRGADEITVQRKGRQHERKKEKEERSPGSPRESRSEREGRERVRAWNEVRKEDEEEGKRSQMRNERRSEWPSEQSLAGETQRERERDPSSFTHVKGNVMTASSSSLNVCVWTLAALA